MDGPAGVILGQDTVAAIMLIGSVALGSTKIEVLDTHVGVTIVWPSHCTNGDPAIIDKTNASIFAGSALSKVVVLAYSRTRTSEASSPLLLTVT